MQLRCSWQHKVIFLWMIALGLGSGYYHWAPSKDTLLWDRLPIAFIASGLIATVVSECLLRRSRALSNALFVLMQLVGAALVFNWYWFGNVGPYMVCVRSWS